MYWLFIKNVFLQNIDFPLEMQLGPTTDFTN